jgi:hypothetical protein
MSGITNSIVSRRGDAYFVRPLVWTRCVEDSESSFELYSFSRLKPTMSTFSALFLFIFLTITCSAAKTIVFWQPGFPTVASAPVTREALGRALEGEDVSYVDLERLKTDDALKDAELLVLPYGSAVPVDAWRAIHAYVAQGGSLIIIGGQPLRVPVVTSQGKFQEQPAQDTYPRELDFRHTYDLPAQTRTRFAWKDGYDFGPPPTVRARRLFAVEGHLDGLGYMVNSDGLETAAPVIVSDRGGYGGEGDNSGARVVALDFDPEPGYWESADGISLIRTAADYAKQGATTFWVEIFLSTVKRGEPVQVTVHLRNLRRERKNQPLSGTVHVELLSGTTVFESGDVACSGKQLDAALYFRKAIEPGFYVVRARYEDGGKLREFHRNGFWVEDQKLLTSGPSLGVDGSFLTRGGKPFWPVGTNYFSTEANGWDFSGPRNAWNWERDFAEMEKYGVTFVRTGVWTPYKRFVEPLTEQVNERFLRNLEAFLLCARRHNIAVNFTFFAFVPRVSMRSGPESAGSAPNAYIARESVDAELQYVLSIVRRFKDVPWLCWDLINEPNFSNPNRLWHGNVPNGDHAETVAWHRWLQEKYGALDKLATAWAVTSESLVSFDAIPLPSEADLNFDRYGNSRHVRTVDYNLFAQDMFKDWVGTMVAAIRATGSQQLIDVGQDEGGVKDRVLNQFFSSAGVSFTTNHTYWEDDALLWDSVVAKRREIPNITGETGYQPVWSADGVWRYDEFTGLPLIERKWALGFAADSSGVLQWDWDREPDFGMKRSDGSAKEWQPMMRDIGRFAEQAAASATGSILPQIAIVLPQSAQLSTWNAFALEAQAKSVRVLYNYTRFEAYAVGEYQIEDLGNPKLIILPSPFLLNQHAWQTIIDHVRTGTTLLVSGRFDEDAHFHPTGRQNEFGLNYAPGPLTSREHVLNWPGGQTRLTYSGNKTTYLDRAFLPDGKTWADTTVGPGKILFSALPLELNDNLQAIADVYKWAGEKAGVMPTYTTTVSDRGVLICPTRFPHATLYVVTSESGQAVPVVFKDERSGRTLSSTVRPGRAAMVLLGDDGKQLASYEWNSPQ